MNKNNLNTSFSRSNTPQNNSPRKESILDNFIDWFRDFLDNAE